MKDVLLMCRNRCKGCNGTIALHPGQSFMADMEKHGWRRMAMPVMC